MKPKLFLALDYDNAESARKIFHKILPTNPYFKVGLELFTAAGPDFVRELVAEGGKIFLDLKFHDIPNTVAKAVSKSAELGVGWINVHCSGGSAMMEAAVAAKKGHNIKLLGVTVLTSLDDTAVREIGYDRSSTDQVVHFAELAKKSGLDGIVCSAQELHTVINICGREFITMVPGIRSSHDAANDQKRTMTPKEASAAHAHNIVVGRPITAAQDPITALKEILSQL